ncbi:MAG: host attachment family protein [Sphingobium sp.]
MQIDHDAMVLVADGRKMLFFRNKGDGTYPNLETESVREQDNPSHLDQSSDKSGQSRGVGTAQGTMGENDRHVLEEQRFAAEAADVLKRGALANDYEKLIIVAPPNALGEMRKHYHKEVSSRLVGELAKDLTNHPVSEIERIISES